MSRHAPLTVEEREVISRELSKQRSARFIELFRSTLGRVKIV